MKRLPHIVLALFWLMFIPKASAQLSPEVDAYLRDFPQRAAFNAHSYEFSTAKDTPAPQGFKAFYISHYGRHGSRSSFAEKSFVRLRDSLSKESAANILTPAGDSVFALSKKLVDLYDGMSARLTQRGAREHAGIARRMYKRFPEVFRQGKVRALSSTAPRCLVSMSAFTTSLVACKTNLSISMDCGEKYQAFLTSSYSKELEKKAIALAVEHTTLPFDTAAVYSRIFTDPEIGRNIISNPRRIISYIYELASYAEAFDIDDNYFAFLPWNAVIALYSRSALKAYLMNCNSLPFGDERLSYASDLAEDILHKADEAIAGSSVSVDLRFGHDWPFMGICAYFGLEGYGYPRLSAEQAVYGWNAARYCPFAANLQMVFYRNDKGMVLVKFLTNEQETQIPELEPYSGPYYLWPDVKNFLSSRK